MGTSYVRCSYCKKKVPRHKAVPLYKRPAWLPPNVEVDFVGIAGEKYYVCISCAKHRGISFRDWRIKILRDDSRHRTIARKKALGKKKKRGQTTS